MKSEECLTQTGLGSQIFHRVTVSLHLKLLETESSPLHEAEHLMPLFFFLFFLFLFIYETALGLHCCAAVCSCGERELLSLVAVYRLLIEVTSLVASLVAQR